MNRVMSCDVLLRFIQNNQKQLSFSLSGSLSHSVLTMNRQGASSTDERRRGRRLFLFSCMALAVVMVVLAPFMHADELLRRDEAFMTGAGVRPLRGYGSALGKFILQKLETDDGFSFRHLPNTKSSSSIGVELTAYGVPAGSDCDTGHKMIIRPNLHTMISTVLCYRELSYPEDSMVDDDPDNPTAWSIQAGRTQLEADHGDGEEFLEVQNEILRFLPLLKTMTHGPNGSLVLTGDEPNLMRLARVAVEESSHNLGGKAD